MPDGAELATHVVYYPRWMGALSTRSIDPATHPLDYIESMEKAVQQVVSLLEPGSALLFAALVSTPLAQRQPLLMLMGMCWLCVKSLRKIQTLLFVLWKDHTAIAEAETITALCHSGKFTDYSRYIGGIYSSEWFWAKICTFPVPILLCVKPPVTGSNCVTGCQRC